MFTKDQLTNLQKPKKSRKTLIIVIISVLIFFSPAILIAGFVVNCKIKQSNHRDNNKEVIEAYHNLKLTSASADIDKTVQLGGDCFDSKPWFRAKQQYTVNKTGTQLLNEFRANMTKQGYRVTNEQFKKSKCGTSYFANAGKEQINISFSLNDYQTSGCYEYLDSSISEAAFRASRPVNANSTLLNQ
jgi:hypothetical protein